MAIQKCNEYLENGQKQVDSNNDYKSLSSTQNIINFNPIELKFCWEHFSLKNGKNRIKKVWHSHNFLLPCVTVKGNFSISTTFIPKLYFVTFVDKWIIRFYIYYLKFFMSFPYYAWVWQHSPNFYQFNGNQRDICSN